MAEHYLGDDVRNMVKQLEGFSETAYVDAKGHSIGFGHFIKPGEEHLLKEKITPEKAEQLLEEDIKSHQKPWIGLLGKDTPSHVVTALTSFAYNVGPYSRGITKAIDAINKGDTDSALKIMSEYNKSYDPKAGAKVTNKVLVERREFEAKIMRGDKITWGEHRKFSASRTFKDTFDYFKQKFGKPVSPNFSTALSDNDGVASNNAEVLQGLRELNRDLRSGSAEDEWLRRLKKEGSGLWAAQ